MNLILYFAACAAAGLTSACSLPLWRRWCRRVGLMDDPGTRKIHDHPIALAGGFAVLSGLLVSVLAGALVLVPESLVDANAGDALRYGLGKRSLQLIAILVGAVAMTFVGAWDDRFELSPAKKFAGQLLVALMVSAAGVRVTLFVPYPWFSYFLTVFWILTVTNAFNFIDNMNGLCAGLGALGGFAFAWVATVQGQYLVALLAWVIFGALVGFLPFNFPRATAFLGDAGSHLVGYLMAVLAILPHFYTPDQPRVLAVLSPLVILAVPLADLMCVVLLRWQRGLPFYVGDTNHFSHRLVRAGFSKTRAVMALWLVAAILNALLLLIL